MGIGYIKIKSNSFLIFYETKAEELLGDLCRLGKTIDGFFFDKYDEKLINSAKEEGKLIGLITNEYPSNSILSNINFIKYNDKLYEVQLSREVDENYNPIYGLLELD